MRDFDFIHSADDVPRVLSIASNAGLTIRDGDPTSEPGPVIIETSQFPDKREGQYYCYRSGWIFGDLPTPRIPAGAFEGQYDMSPGVNAVGIELYFSGERQDEQGCRLGSAMISRRVDWYSPEHHEVYLAPPEVKEVFETICKRLKTGKRVRAGGRTYHLLPGALAKIKQGYLPPFDFIEWPPELR